MNNFLFVNELKDIEFINYMLKSIFFNLYIFFIAYKISNIKMKNIMIAILEICIASIITTKLKFVSTFIVSSMFSIIAMIVLFRIRTKKNLSYSILLIVISTSLNYIIFIVSVILNYFPSFLFNIQNNYIGLVGILIIYSILMQLIIKIKKFKYGIQFVQKTTQNDSINIMILNISIIVIFAIIIFENANMRTAENLFIGLIIFSISMFITIQKSLQLYYKQKMLIKDLTETKEELENKKKEIEELEAENIRISKKNHTIVHKQKSIEHKLEEMLIKSEISIEEAGEVKERLEKLHNQIYSEKENTELDKTGISDIDDMLNYMQSECTKNKIEFTLIIKGNIHYMVNNLISKEDLETLIADHIKDAIIAINHTDNINRSILVKLGNIDGIYSLYIYDSGVEFKKEVLENLGIKPFTTYESEGGTGMGFMNTFDTLRKYKASLIIEEFNEPKPDNYTKLIAIKFDNNNKFEIKSYRKIEIKKKI